MELLTAFFLIFMAEMGDKTQILAMAFSTKYKIKQVIIGIFIGSLLNHSLAVLLGANLYRIIPIETLSIIAGLSFILFGVWNLQIDTDDSEETKSKFGPIMTVSLAFFIGELGDKTQLTAIILATDAQYPILILCGTVLGMVFTGSLGIFVGIKLGSKIDEFYIKIAASAIFFLFGYIKLFENTTHNLITPMSITVFSLLVFALSGFLLHNAIKDRKVKISKYKRIATRLENYYSSMYQDIENICLGENHCGKCDGQTCLVGYIKFIINKAKNNQFIDLEDLTNKLNKGYNKTKILEALNNTITFLQTDWSNKKYFKVHLVRETLEMILYKEKIEADNFKEYMNKLKTKDNKFYQFLVNN